MRRRRGGGDPDGTNAAGGPAAGPAGAGGSVTVWAGGCGPYPGGYGAVSVPPRAVARAYPAPYRAVLCRPGRSAV